MNNRFCDPSSLEKFNYPKWTSIDALKWKIPSLGGQQYLFQYKKDFVHFHRLRIKSQAAVNNIPPELLGCVAFNEAGGMPDRIKIGVLAFREFDWSGPSWVDKNFTVTNRPEKTSVGIIAMQIGVAAQTVDPKLQKLSYSDRKSIKICMFEDAFNIAVVARHLKNLILFDYPGIDTRHLTKEQFIVAGSRYNRGTQRKKEDFIASIYAPTSNIKVRTWTSYGRAMWKYRPLVISLLK